MKAIACVDMRTNGIGANGELLYHIKKDMTRFKSLTENGTVIMGRLTQESLPIKKLVNRKNIVLTRTELTSSDPDIEYVSNIMDEVVLKYFEDDNAFVIGGEEVYKQLVPLCTHVYITKVITNNTLNIKPDKFFPKLLEEYWEIVDNSSLYHDEDTGLLYQFLTYRNKNRCFPRHN